MPTVYRLSSVQAIRLGHERQLYFLICGEWKHVRTFKTKEVAEKNYANLYSRLSEGESVGHIFETEGEFVEE
jgi:hypothetical protein